MERGVEVVEVKLKKLSLLALIAFSLPLLAAEPNQAVTWEGLAKFNAAVNLFWGVLYSLIGLAYGGVAGFVVVIIGAAISAAIIYFVSKLIYQFFM